MIVSVSHQNSNRRLTPCELIDLNRYFEEQSPLDLLNWSIQAFGDQIAQITSFGLTGLVVLDLLMQLKPTIRVMTLDTGYLFPETYTLWQRIQERYNIKLEIHHPAISQSVQTELYGPNLWEKDPDQCCYLRKVLPLRSALGDLSAWITGLRRDQSATRSATPLITWDRTYNLVKINPLANWQREQVWHYVRKHNLPYNPLHDMGYLSVGCRHCTHPSLNKHDERSGRWVGHAKKECGIHVPPDLLNIG